MAPTEELDEIAALAVCQHDESADNSTALGASAAPEVVGSVNHQSAALGQGQQASGALESLQAFEAQGDSQTHQAGGYKQASPSNGSAISSEEIAKEVVAAADSSSPPRRSA